MLTALMARIKALQAENRQLQAAISRRDEELRQYRRSEQRMRQSEERYRTVVEDQTELICRLTADGVLTFVNEAYCRYFGASRKDLIGTRFEPRIPAEDQSLVRATLMSLVPAHPVCTVEHRVILPSGEIRWQRWIDRAIYDVEGNLLELQAVGQDITDWKRADLARRESEARLQALLNNTHQSFTLISVDGYIQALNAAARRSMSLTVTEREVQVGDPIEDYIPTNYIESFRENFHRALNGEIVTVERGLHDNWWIFSYYPVLSNEGDIIGVAMSALDITQRKQAEMALLESERKFRSVIEQSYDAIRLIDTEGRITEWNQRNETLTGLRAEDVTGRFFWDVQYQFVPPDHRNTETYNRLKRNIQEFLRTGKASWANVPQEFRLVRPDGTERILQSVVFPIQTEAGNMACSVVRDVTDFKEAEVALRQSEQKFRSIVEQSNDGIVLIDRQGLILEWNRGQEQITGLMREDVLGTFIGDLQYNLAPSERRTPELKARIHRVVRDLLDGEATIDPSTPMGYEIERPDGTHRTIESVMFPIETDGERLLCSIIHDITPLKITEQTLAEALRLAHEAEQRFRSVVNNAPDTIYILNAKNGTQTFLNRPMFLGYTIEELLDLAPLLHPEDAEMVLAHRKRLLKEGVYSHNDLEYRHRRKDGGWEWVRSRESVLSTDEDGQPQEILVTLTVTTERKNAEEALKVAKAEAEAASRAKSSFIANMSHELRTPLNAILGFAQLMQRDPVMTTQEENLRTIMQSGEHLLSLINDILEMSRIESGQVVLTKQTVDLYTMLDNLERMLRVQSDEKRLYLEFEIAENVPHYVQADGNKLRQVLINLMGNAIKFTHEGGIDLRVNYDAACLYFAIQDSGIGIDESDIERLFESFAQTNRSNQIQEGTGLGLYISRKFVQLMGGDITIDSQPDQGTLVRFHIAVGTVREQDVPNVDPVRRVVGLQPGQPDFRILVAEDRSENRRLLMQMLAGVGFMVRGAANGQEAVEIAARWQPDLIFMDLRMPVMNGYDATRFIKQERSDVTVIALTASVFEHDQVVSRQVGCDDFISKPFRESELFEKLARHLDVHYVYEGDPSPAVLHPGTLRRLAPDWLKNLSHAAVRLDVEESERLISVIERDHPAVGGQLRTMVQQFQFEELLQLLQEADR